MGVKLKKIITLSTDNFNILKTTGSVTINGKTLTYDDTGATLYLTPDDGEINVDRLNGIVNPDNLPIATFDTPGIVKIEGSGDTAASNIHNHDDKYIKYSGGDLTGTLFTHGLVPAGGAWSIGTDVAPYNHLYINTINAMDAPGSFTYGPGAEGQVLMSDGVGNTYWGDVTANNITGIFTINDENNGYNIEISPYDGYININYEDQYLYIQPNSMIYSDSSYEYEYIFPTKSGTLALTSDIPTSAVIQNNKAENSHYKITIDNFNLGFHSYLSLLLSTRSSETILVNLTHDTTAKHYHALRMTTGTKNFITNIYFDNTTGDKAVYVAATAWSIGLCSTVLTNSSNEASNKLKSTIELVDAIPSTAVEFKIEEIQTSENSLQTNYKYVGTNYLYKITGFGASFNNTTEFSVCLYSRFGELVWLNMSNDTSTSTIKTYHALRMTDTGMSNKYIQKLQYDPTENAIYVTLNSSWSINLVASVICNSLHLYNLNIEQVDSISEDFVEIPIDENVDSSNVSTYISSSLSNYYTKDQSNANYYTKSQVNAKTWGISKINSESGVYKSSNIFPINYSKFDFARANRLSFMPKTAVVIERSSDGGETWEVADVPESQIVNFFTNPNNDAIPLYEAPAISTDISNYKLRITLDAYNGTAYNERYFGNWYNTCIWVGTNYSSGLKVTLQQAKIGSENTFVDVSGFVDIPLSGWSGPNDIWHDSVTYGGNSTQTSQARYVRFIFSADSTTNTNYSPTIRSIAAYSTSVWGIPNQLMYNDHLYKIGNDKSAIFPGAISNNTIYIGNNNAISNKTVATTYLQFNPDGNIYYKKKNTELSEIATKNDLDSYLPLTGGTIYGDLTADGDIIVGDITDTYTTVIGNSYITTRAGDYEFDVYPEDGYFSLYKHGAANITFNVSDIQHDDWDGNHFTYTYPTQSGELVVKNSSNVIEMYGGGIMYSNPTEGWENVHSGFGLSWDGCPTIVSNNLTLRFNKDADFNDYHYQYTFPEKSGKLVIEGSKPMFEEIGVYSDESEIEGHGFNVGEDWNDIDTYYCAHGIRVNNADTDDNYYLYFPPYKTGTLALVEDLNSYLPKTGGTVTGNISLLNENYTGIILSSGYILDSQGRFGLVFNSSDNKLYYKYSEYNSAASLWEEHQSELATKDDCKIKIVDTLPTPSETYRGTQMILAGEDSDELYICLRKSNAYTWVKISSEEDIYGTLLNDNYGGE